MATERQQQLEQVFRLALEEHGPGVSTEFLIAATSERTQADPREIIEAVEDLDRRPRPPGPDEGTGCPHAVAAQDDTTRERLAVFLHAIHFRTTDGIKARAIPEPDSLGG